ncbi:MAG: ClpXP protease specificity-enhancing factor [Xanthomonadales bacterium]|nr:ClpXP protease specificity-enhancing factor [Xanthomonadales bacterium]
MPKPEMTPNRPYLLRALHQWIVDNGMTPHLLVDAQADGVDVPAQVVQNGKVILNVSPNAVQGLDLGNEWIMMDARFSGKPHQLSIPVIAVIAVYARENGQGMMFTDEADTLQPPPEPDGSDSPAKPAGSHLKVVK